MTFITTHGIHDANFGGPDPEAVVITISPERHLALWHEALALPQQFLTLKSGYTDCLAHQWEGTTITQYTWGGWLIEYYRAILQLRPQDLLDMPGCAPGYLWGTPKQEASVRLLNYTCASWAELAQYHAPIANVHSMAEKMEQMVKSCSTIQIVQDLNLLAHIG